MKKSISTTLIFLLSLVMFGQNRTYIGIETAVTSDYFEFIDRGNQLKSTPLISGLWGINIHQDLNNYFSLESGIIRNYYSEGFGFNVKPFANEAWISNSFNSWQIPLRINSKIALIKNKIFFTTTIGLHYCINSEFDGYGSGSLKETSWKSADSISVIDTSDYRIRRSFPLLETGLGFEFRFFKNVFLMVSTKYCTGFKKVATVNYTYQINNDPTGIASSYSKGDYWCFGIEIRYPLSDIWMNKKQK